MALNAYVTWLTVESDEKPGFQVEGHPITIVPGRIVAVYNQKQLLLLDRMTSKHHHRSFMDED